MAYILLQSGSNPAQPTPTGPSTALMVTLAILGCYGAGEAFFRLLRGVPRVYQWLIYKWRNRHLAKDFYYKKREACYRIYPDGKTYLYIRRESVVALKDNLSEIPFTFRWTGEGSVVPSVSPASYSLIDATRIKGQINERKLIRLDHAINKGDQVDFIVTLKCTCDRKEPEPFLGTSSSHRMDRLKLRLVFPLENVPKKVQYVMRDRDGNELDRRTVEDVDLITGEYGVEVKRPEAHTVYHVEWEY